MARKEYVFSRGVPTNTTASPQHINCGRPPKSFEESSERSKRRKTITLRQSASAAELSYAAKVSLHSEGKRTAAKLMHEVSMRSPTRAKQINTAWKSAQLGRTIMAYTPDKALSLLVEAKLSKSQYQLLRTQAKEHGTNLYPSYHKVKEAKKNCYPEKEYTKVTNSSAEINLQSLLNHTAKRILQIQCPVLATLSADDISNLVLVTK